MRPLFRRLSYEHVAIPGRHNRSTSTSQGSSDMSRFRFYVQDADDLILRFDLSQLARTKSEHRFWRRVQSALNEWEPGSPRIGSCSEPASFGLSGQRLDGAGHRGPGSVCSERTVCPAPLTLGADWFWTLDCSQVSVLTIDRHAVGTAVCCAIASWVAETQRCAFGTCHCSLCVARPLARLVDTRSPPQNCPYLSLALMRATLIHDFDQVFQASGRLGVMYLKRLRRSLGGSRSISTAPLCYDKQRLPNY